MSVHLSPGSRLRALLGDHEVVVAPGASDALTARLIEKAGFPAVYVTGAGIANALLGVPDVGLTTLTEVAAQAAHIVACGCPKMRSCALTRHDALHPGSRGWPKLGRGALINGVVKAWSAALAEHRRSRRCRVLLVDETSMRKRHRYVTVIVNGDTGQTLAMVQHRSSAALSTFLMQQGHRWCKGVKVVVSDGSKAYKSAIDAHLGHARHVLDRFHVIRWFSAGLTAVRRDIQRRPEGSKPAFDPEVFRARFALLRRGDTLTDADRARLETLFHAHPRLKAGWQALQELHGLYLADDHQGALEALGRFCDLYETGELPEYHDTHTGGASRPGGSDPCHDCALRVPSL